MRLDLIFGSSTDKDVKSEQSETRKENFNQLEKDLAKFSSVKREETAEGTKIHQIKQLQPRKGDSVEEAYDPEIEYQEASARILNEAKLNDQNLKLKAANVTQVTKSGDSSEKRKKNKSPDKKVNFNKTFIAFPINLD